MNTSLSLSRPPFLLKNSIHFKDHTFKGELILEIFKWINQSSVIRNCALTCRGWNSIIPDSFHLRFTMRMNDFSFPVRTLFKATHWPQAQCLAICEFAKGKLFYCSKETITIPLGYLHPFKYVNIANHDLIISGNTIIRDNYTVFGDHGGIYVLQPWLKAHTLIINRDLTKPNVGETIFLEDLDIYALYDLSFTWCFPLSNEKIAFISRDNDLKEPIKACHFDLNLKTIISKKIISEGEELSFLSHEELDQSSPIQFGNYFILNRSIINLENFEMTAHSFDFKDREMTVFGSSLYLSGELTGRGEIGSYFINAQEKLEKKWEIKQLKSDGDKEIFVNKIKVNDQFIALLCQVSNLEMAYNQNRAFRCIHLLKTDGTFVHEIKFSMREEITIHLVDDILIYKLKRENCLNFWHIPTDRFLNQFPWNGSEIDSIQSTSEEIIFLTSREEDDSRELITFKMR